MSATPPAVKNPKVFCSHRQCDKPRVREIATKLREAGIDAWLDQWEIKPGDDFVAAINEGLASYDVGLIFFSNEIEHGKWVQAEISAITVRAVEDGKAVIPVMLDPEVPVSPLLRSRSRLGYEQLDQLIDAIYGRTGKPALGAPLQAAEQRSFVIKLRQKEEGEVGVSAEVDGKPKVPEQPVRISADLAFSYAEFLRSRLPGARLSAEAVRAARDSDLQKLGDAVGQLLFPQAVEAAFLGVADEAAKNNAQVELIVETAAPELLAIPFEAARLKNGRTPALESGVRMARRLAGLNAKAPDPQPGPLKVLVAVGAPDEGKTANVVLDMERELQSILDAVEDARKYGNAYVRILDVGSLDEIRSSLAEQHYHVLHLSGHGNAGVLELEDEDGNPVQTTAKDIAEAIRDSGKPSPLVFLASCLSGAGDSDTASLAHALLQQGVPAVLAMQTSVTDHYSTELAKAFYTNLSKGDRPQVSQALALARQEVERERRKAVAQGKHFPAEYATPSLFFAGEE
jgi:CHAT domain/TIR domain